MKNNRINIFNDYNKHNLQIKYIIKINLSNNNINKILSKIKIKNQIIKFNIIIINKILKNNKNKIIMSKIQDKITKN